MTMENFLDSFTFVFSSISTMSKAPVITIASIISAFLSLPSFGQKFFLSIQENKKTPGFTFYKAGSKQLVND
jgi:hypothetical protein